MSCVVMQGCSPGSMLTRSRMSCKVFSFRKAQLVQEKVTYLGYEISGRQRSLGTERKEAICQMPRPETVRDLRAFLGMTGWCHLWIYQYGILAKPLYELLKKPKVFYSGHRRQKQPLKD
ncbi:uncharacterized protein LOC126646879 isoform X1 [Myiozetetes cayanensis]|uniref:uncharacterized protein LOC126646879 isoform X1 n=1 Tax=Myiozetetes cayanensis TaxID=478635 RepID=UPI002160DB2E|nr:uncharacterized protein LOC126646879 isoform X1 [Myiozetetes cayanensis]